MYINNISPIPLVDIN